MATALPTLTTTDKEIMNVLREQNSLLSSVLQSVSGNRQEQKNANNSIQQLVKSFSGNKAVKTNVGDIQIKTLEETRLVSATSSQMAKDISFIRRAFEDNSKEKDRKLLAQEISENQEKRSGGIFSALFKGIGIVAIGAALWKVFGPTIKEAVGKTFSKVKEFLSLGFSSLTDGINSVIQGVETVINSIMDFIMDAKRFFNIGYNEEDDIPASQRSFVNAARANRDEITRKQFEALPEDERKIAFMKYSQLEKDEEIMAKAVQDKINYLEEMGRTAGLSEEESILLEKLRLLEKDNNEKQKKLLKSSSEKNIILGKMNNLFEDQNDESNDMLDNIKDGLASIVGTAVDMGKRSLDFLGEEVMNLGKLKFRDEEGNPTKTLDLFDGMGDALKGAVDMGQKQLQEFQDNYLPGLGNVTNNILNQSSSGGKSQINLPSASPYNTNPTYLSWVESTRLR